MKTKTISIFIGIAIIIAGGVFYGGMKYEQNKRSLNGISHQNFQNISSEQREQFTQEKMGKEIGASSFTGEVIDKDEQSIVLKILNNGSKIIFFSDSTEISKTIEGSINDIGIGKQIMVRGDQNSDGSYTAKIIQLSSR